MSAPNRKAADHHVQGGRCIVCARVGGELSTPCPGYRTAGELIKEWPKRVATTKAKTTTTTKKGKRK